MRDYMIEGLPHNPTVSVEYVAAERLPRISEVALKLAEEKGYRRDDPGRARWHLDGDVNKPPRVVIQMIVSQGLRQLQFAGLPPTRDRSALSAWILKLPDDALVQLLRVCVERTN